MLPLATITIASLGLSPVTYPQDQQGKTTNKNNTLYNNDKTIARTIITVAPLEILLVTCLKQGSKVRNTI
jgi:hypothetical protein